MLLAGSSLVTVPSSSLELGLASFGPVFLSDLTSTGRLLLIGAAASDFAFPISEPIWSVSAVQKTLLSAEL